MDMPIHDALEKLWDELIDDDRYKMVAVLLYPEQQKALHSEMDFGFSQSQRYEPDLKSGRWTWRYLPIMRPEDNPTGYSRHAPCGDNMVGIGCKVLPR